MGGGESGSKQKMSELSPQPITSFFSPLDLRWEKAPAKPSANNMAVPGSAAALPGLSEIR